MGKNRRRAQPVSNIRTKYKVIYERRASEMRPKICITWKELGALNIFMSLLSFSPMRKCEKLTRINPPPSLRSAGRDSLFPNKIKSSFVSILISHPPEWGRQSTLAWRMEGNWKLNDSKERKSIKILRWILIKYVIIYCGTECSEWIVESTLFAWGLRRIEKKKLNKCIWPAYDATTQPWRQ